MESMNLKVELPMKIEVDNKGAVDLVNGWSCSGGTKHMDVRIMFMRELKENKVLEVVWQPTAEKKLMFLPRIQMVQRLKSIWKS